MTIGTSPQGEPGSQWPRNPHAENVLDSLTADTLDQSTAPAVSWPRIYLVGLLIAVGIGVVIRAALLPTQGLRGDIDQFVLWVNHIANRGLPNAYDEDLSFGPVMAYVWAVLGAIEPAFRSATDASDTGLRVLMKLPATLADFGLAACVAWILRATPRWAALGAVLVLLHPATWYVSAWWGQYESIYVLAALLAVLFAVGGRDGLAAAALAVAVLTKPQALPFLLPFAAWFLARGGIRHLLRAALIGVLVAFVIWLPFLAAGGPLKYLGSLGDYQNDVFSVLSLRAWNFWWLVQDMAPTDEFVSDRVAILGPITLRTVGYAITLALSLAVALRVYRDPRPRTLILGLAATTLISFAFLTTMHERYAYGALAFLMLLIPEARLRWLGLAFGVVFTLNLVAAIPATTELAQLVPTWGPIGVIGSLVLVMLAIAASVMTWRAPAAADSPVSIADSQSAGA